MPERGACKEARHCGKTLVKASVKGKRKQRNSVAASFTPAIKENESLSGDKGGRSEPAAQAHNAANEDLRLF